MKFYTVKYLPSRLDIFAQKSQRAVYAALALSWVERAAVDADNAEFSAFVEFFKIFKPAVTVHPLAMVVIFYAVELAVVLLVKKYVAMLPPARVGYDLSLIHI